MHPVHTLIYYALNHALIYPLDKDYVFNRLTHLLEINGLKPPEEVPYPKTPPIDEILKPLLDHAVNIGKINPDTTIQRDLFESQLMDILTPRPSELTTRFYNLHKINPKAATNDYYALSQATNYIKMTRIAKNEAYTVPSTYGDIEITINLSKPEKDPKDIANMKNTGDYPSCLLCKEYVGFYGNPAQPPRTNHRIIPISLNNEPFYLQYSPYVYYNEHAIVLHEKHIPMEVKEHTFKRLLDFIDLFPHYFMGSNAGLPIVGGSILHHEHYQGGHAHFPIEDAKILDTLHLKDVTYEILHWPLSTVRLKSKHKQSLIRHAEHLRQTWENYTNQKLNIIAHTKTPHNAITPIARKDKQTYILDIALRNNRTNDDYPDGIFHPHPDKYHIKKENIGLIEVMGLAILPGRLKEDFEHIEAILKNERKTFNNSAMYKDWITYLKTLQYSIPIKEMLRLEAGKVFIAVLEDCGVFKQNEAGLNAFKTFIKNTLNTLEANYD